MPSNKRASPISKAMIFTFILLIYKESRELPQLFQINLTIITADDLVQVAFVTNVN